MNEILFDDDEDSTQWITPDPQGFTMRTRYKGTQAVLDRNAASRADAPSTFREDGVEYSHAASLPMEVYEQMQIRLGRPPSAEECLELAGHRDFSKLKTRDKRF